MSLRSRIAERILQLGDDPILSSAWKQLRGELKIARLHRESLEKLRQAPPEPPLRLNLGCGPNGKPGWVNIALTKGADYKFDLRRPLPFPDDSAEIVYSEHFFEHLEYPDEVQRFLAEARRVLAPGGLLSTGVPDTEGILVAYQQRSETMEPFDHVKAMGWHPAWCDTPMHQVNFHFRQGSEHRYAWDRETLERVLADAGFCAIHERPFDPELDSEERRYSTIYVDAEVPR